MKYILITLIAVYVFFFTCALLHFDLISSVIPGWNSALIPDTAHYLFFIVFNVAMPLYFFFYYRKSVNSILLIGYFLMNIFFYVIPHFVSANYMVNGKFNIERYESYALTFLYLFIASRILDLFIYSYLLSVELRLKRQLN